MGKICRECKEDKPESAFYKNIPDCKKCVLKQRAERYRTDRAYYLNNRYNTMRRRAAGLSVYPTGASGKPICTKEEFLNWYEETKDVFEKLWEAHVADGYSLTLAPSVDRIHSEKGYEIGNLQWLTVSDNSSKQDKSPFDYARYTASGEDTPT